MNDKQFNFDDVLGYGWQVMKANFWFFVGLGFLIVLLSIVPDILRQILIYAGVAPAILIPLFVLLMIADYAISFIVGIGIVKIALSFCDGHKPSIGTLFDIGDCFWRFVGGAALYGLIVLGGTLLLIVPGIIWSIQFSQFKYFVIDKGLGPVDALKASSRTTMGVKWKLLGFGFVCAGIQILGLLCLLVGALATYPIIIVAGALVYRQLAAQTPELAEFGATVQYDEQESGQEELPVNDNF